MGNFKTSVSARLHRFKKFIYDGETGEILGRNLLSWGQLGLFFAVFFTCVGSFFAAQLAIFVAITPSPNPGIAPWNFGGYAYPNYPNSKLELISVPGGLRYNGSHFTFSSDDRSRINGLLNAAESSGVSCMNSSNNYGYVENKTCVLIRVAKVFQWTPESIQRFLPAPVRFGNYLNISCKPEDDNIQITVSTVPPGIPLNISSNNRDGGSFPFQNQDNYITPLVGVVIDVASMSPSPGSRSRVSLRCGVDLEALGISGWSSKRLSRIYEIPKDVIITMKF